MLEQEKDSTWEEGETMCNEVTIIPTPCSPSSSYSWKGGREGWEKLVLRFYFTPHYPALILLLINSVNVSNLSLFCLWRQYLGSDFSHSLTHETFVIVSLPCSAVEGSESLWCLESGQNQPCTIVVIFLLGAKYLPFVSSEDSLEGCVRRISARSCIPTSPIACWSGSCRRALITFQQNDGGPESWKLKYYWPANFSAPGSFAMQTLVGIWKSANELGEARVFS